MTVTPSLDRLTLVRAALGEVAELRETHASWVLLGATAAYKVKKPVRLPFLDFSTLERRRTACHAEIELNRTLAPDVYRGMRSLVLHGGEASLVGGDDPDAVEYVVEMRRYAERDTLAARLARGAGDPGTVDRLGVLLAEFHERMPIVPGHAGAEPMRRWADDTVASLTTLARSDHEQRLIVRAACLNAAFIASRREQLDERAMLGRVRDGHGDLRLEHVLLERDRLSIVDCIEFDEHLRRIDVASDLAFLVMDLHAAGRPDLAARLVGAYRYAGGDAGDDALIAWLASYRAQVRAKVSYLRAAQQHGEDAEASGAEAHRLLMLADHLGWAARGAPTIVVAGPAASGKSTLARTLADRTGRRVFASDRVRKADAGLPATEHGGPELYTKTVNRQVYTELGALAAQEAGGAIVDATFRHARDRAAFLSAHDPTPLVVVECRTPLAVRRERAGARVGTPGAVSDADVAIATTQEMEPLDEIVATDHVTLRGDAAVETQIDAIAGALDRRLLDAALTP